MKLLKSFIIDNYAIGDDSEYSRCSRLGITDEDARWVGAWWIGFLCSGSLFVTVVIGIFPFPKETPGQVTYRTLKLLFN